MSKEELERKLSELVNSITGYYNVEVKEYKYQSHIVIIHVYTKYLEISESCTETQDEDEFYECLTEELNEINKESSINFEMKYSNKDFTIEAYPILCSGDYCEAGLGIEIDSTLEIDYEILYPIVKQIIELAFNLDSLSFEITAKNIKEIISS